MIKMMSKVQCVACGKWKSYEISADAKAQGKAEVEAHARATMEGWIPDWDFDALICPDCWKDLGEGKPKTFVNTDAKVDRRRLIP